MRGSDWPASGRGGRGTDPWAQPPPPAPASLALPVSPGLPEWNRRQIPSWKETAREEERKGSLITDVVGVGGTELEVETALDVGEGVAGADERQVHVVHRRVAPISGHDLFGSMEVKGGISSSSHR